MNIVKTMYSAKVELTRSSGFTEKESCSAALKRKQSVPL